jgi:hypothetical protein
MNKNSFFKKHNYSSGEWKEKEFIKSKMLMLDMNKYNNNIAWGLCIIQDTYNICSDAMVKVLDDFGVSKARFYRAKHKLAKGGTPGSGKCTILSADQWKNVEDKIMSNFQKGEKTRAVEVSTLV